MILDPLYCDVIIMRWQDFTGQEASHEDGRSFGEVKSERLVKAGEVSDFRVEVVSSEEGEGRF